MTAGKRDLSARCFASVSQQPRSLGDLRVVQEVEKQQQMARDCVLGKAGDKEQT